jgi:hypothetical protein
MGDAGRRKTEDGRGTNDEYRKLDVRSEKREARGKEARRKEGGRQNDSV